MSTKYVCSAHGFEAHSKAALQLHVYGAGRGCSLGVERPVALPLEELVEGGWYEYVGPSSQYLRTGQKVKVVEVDAETPGVKYPVCVWGMGFARKEDEDGICIGAGMLAPWTGKQEK